MKLFFSICMLCILYTYSFSQIIVDQDSLISYYNFDDCTLHDYNNVHHGIANGNLQFYNHNGNNCLKLDGQSFVDLGLINELDWSKEFTISLRFKIDSLHDGMNALFCRSFHGLDWSGNTEMYTQPGSIMCHLWGSTLFAYFGSFSLYTNIEWNGVNSVNDNEWHSLIYVLDKNNTDFYSQGCQLLWIDNNLVQVKPVYYGWLAGHNSDPFYIGKQYLWSNSNFIGCIDDFMILKKAVYVNYNSSEFANNLKVKNEIFFNLLGQESSQK